MRFFYWDDRRTTTHFAIARAESEPHASRVVSVLRSNRRRSKAARTNVAGGVSGERRGGGTPPYKRATV